MVPSARQFDRHTRQLLVLFAILIALGGLCALMRPLAVANAQTASGLSLRPVTWEVIGLDQASPDLGPFQYVLGAELCVEPTGATVSQITATLQLAANPSLSIIDSPNRQLASLSGCTTLHYNLTVTDTTSLPSVQAYTLSASGSNPNVSGSLPGSLDIQPLAALPIPADPPTVTEVYSLEGPTELTVGQTYAYVAQAGPLISGTGQLVNQVSFPGDLFQITGIQHSVGLPGSAPITSTNRMYIDACAWDPAGNTCTSAGSLAGTSTITYTVKVLAEGFADLEHLVYGYAPDADPATNFYYLDMVGIDNLFVEASAPPITSTPVVTQTQTAVAIQTGTAAAIQTGTAAAIQTQTAAATLTSTLGVTQTQTAVAIQTGTAAAQQTAVAAQTQTAGAPGTGTASVIQTGTARVQQTGTAVSRLTQTAAASAADPVITYTVSPREARTGASVTFTARILNEGDGPATASQFVVTLPSSLDIRSVSTTLASSEGSYTTNASTRTVTVNLGTLDPDESETITIVAVVNTSLTTTTTVTNQGRLTYTSNGTKSLNSPSVSIRLIGTTTLPNTGGIQLEREAPHLYLPAMLTAILLGLIGVASIVYGFRSRTRRPLWADWYLKTGMMLVAVGLVFGVVARTFLPSPGSTLQSIAQVSEEQAPTPSPENNAEASLDSEEEPLDLWWPTSTSEPAVLPDFPIPTPSVQPTPGEPEPDTSAVTQLTIPQLQLNTIVKYVPYDGLTWLIAGLQNEIAWLGETSWPGLGGNTAMAGHVTLANGARGPFYGLEQLEDNAEIIVYTEQNVYTYRVREVRQAEETDLTAVSPADKSQISLITCSDWNNETKFYQKRTVVTAELVDVKPKPETVGMRR